MKGFYKKIDDGSLQRANQIHTPAGSFDEGNQADAPSEWVWFDVAEDAYAHFASVGAVTKLTIKRRLDALGKWGLFKQVLKTLPESVQDEWDLALEIAHDDPIFSANADGLKAALGLTDEEFAGILE